MVSRLSRLRVLSVLLPLVLVAPPLGGRLSDRAADVAASSQPSGTLSDLHGVACPSPSTCVAVGGDTILRSTDGGRTWRRQPSGTTIPLNGVACLSPSTCVAVGGDTILRSTDGGRTWRRQPSPIGYVDRGCRVNCPGHELIGVACARPSTCVVVGGWWDGGYSGMPPRGTILRSTDGGRTWRRQPSATTHILNGVACPSPSTCVVVGEDTILRSTDGGRTWRRV